MRPQGTYDLMSDMEEKPKIKMNVIIVRIWTRNLLANLKTERSPTCLQAWYITQ
jgi:hypothetical protein